MNLLITTCANYKRSDLEVFVKSFRGHVKNTELVVFTNNLDQETVKWLKGVGATLEPMQIAGWKRGLFNRYAKLTKRNPLRFLPRPLALRWAWHLAPIMSLRFLYYRRWLSQQAGKYEKVFITDSKDVVFQSDPFSCLQNEELQFFLENHSIGAPNDVNAIWMSWVYPPQESRFLFGQLNSCAGTTLGSASGMLSYLKSMNEEFVRAVLTPRHGEDQAMHNMILRRENCDFQRRVVPNAEGAVLTVLGCPPEDYTLGPDDLVRNKQGEVIPVLHTYDRFPELVKAQRRRLGLNIN